jgi:hypothetical protein
MAEEQHNEDSQKTLVAFVVGLLIGGILVWAFTGPSTSAPKDEMKKDEVTASTTTENTGDTANTGSVKTGDKADITVEDQSAGKSVKISDATYPVAEGWIAVRDYQDDKEGYVLGAMRFSKRDGLNPMEIELQRPTIAGHKYAISVYEETGDNDWGNDKKLEAAAATFMAK